MANPIVKYASGSKKSDHVDIIRACVNDDMICKLQPEAPQLDYKALVLGYWTEELMDTVINIMDNVVHPVQLSQLNMSFDRSVTVEHPALPYPVSTDLKFRVRQPSGGKIKPWPANMESDGHERFSGTPETYTVAHDIAMNALDRGLLREVIMWLCEVCTTHEQAAYLLPGWVPMLRRANFREIANDIEGCKRPKTLPDVPPIMRKKLRWAHTFLAMHELLETFDKRPRKDNPDLCRVLLDDTKTISVKWDEARYSVSFI